MKGSRRKKRKQRPKQPVAGASPSPEKQPHSRFHPEARKIPTVEERRDFMRLHPRWRFSLLELQGAYRITAKERVWGLLVEDVFYLLWWDPEHEVCPSHLKHT